VPVYNATLQQIDEKETRRYAGLARSEDFPTKLISEACLEVQSLAKPAGIYEIYPYQAEQALIAAPEPLELTGEVIKKHLAGAEKVAILAVTIGNQLEQAITGHFEKGEYTSALLLDAAATTAVEMVADQLNELIDQQAARLGYRTTWRFSPGYGNWDITAQSAIIKLAGAEQIGITVTETAMMSPRKSVSAVIGFIPRSSTIVTAADSEIKNTCANCSQVDCHSKKTK
jgi:hypothetical protein